MYYGVEDFLEKVAAKQEYDFSNLSDEELYAAARNANTARAYAKLLPISVGLAAGGVLGGRALGRKIGARYGRDPHVAGAIGSMAGAVGSLVPVPAIRKALIANDDDVYYVNALNAEFNRRKAAKEADKINHWRNK